MYCKFPSTGHFNKKKLGDGKDTPLNSLIFPSTMRGVAITEGLAAEGNSFHVFSVIDNHCVTATSGTGNWSIILGRPVHPPREQRVGESWVM